MVILGINISHQYNYLSTGQFNITNEEVNNILLNYNIIENPFAKFSFNENGTLLKIYLPNEKNIQFTASLIIDLIEKIIPRISKKYFEKKDINKELLLN